MLFEELGLSAELLRAIETQGYRQGDLASVTQSVEEIVMRLNERRIGKRGRVHLDMSHRGKPAKTG